MEMELFLQKFLRWNMEDGKKISHFQQQNKLHTSLFMRRDIRDTRPQNLNKCYMWKVLSLQSVDDHKYHKVCQNALSFMVLRAKL